MKATSYIIIFILFSTALPLQAARINNISNLNFGSLTASPFGNIIKIDASGGEKSPVIISGIGHLSGGSSGRIQFVPDQSGQRVHIDYPVSFSISNSVDSMIINQIGINSCTDFTANSTSPVDVYIGGVLTISPAQATGNYSGSTTINITINNP